MTPLAFAWRSLVRQPARAVLGVAGIAVVGALLFDMLLLAGGLVVSFERLLESVGYDVRATATDTVPGTGPLVADGAGLVRRLEALDQIADASGFRFGRAEAAGARPGAVRVELIGAAGPARDTWTVVTGADLDFAERGGLPQLVVNRRMAQRLQLAPGGTVVLRGRCREGSSALPPVAYHLAGVVDFRFDDGTGFTALTDLGSLAATCDLDDPAALDLLLVATAAGTPVAEAIEAVRRIAPELHVFSNRQLVERVAETNFSYFRQVSFALSVVTLSFAFLLTATLLTVAVNQRLGEIAGLRAIGFSRHRVILDLLCESGLLVGAGALLSLPLGGLLAWRLDAILRQMPGLPQRLHFFVFQPEALAAHLSLLLLAGLLAAVYPVYLAARLPIAATLRRETVS
jgi:ABC-type lipoprotein release transport system permease subunit